jgi:hypothetical protein
MATEGKDSDGKKGAGEVSLSFPTPAPDSVVRVANSLASIEAIVADRAAEWQLFADTDTGKFGSKEKALTKALIELFRG